MDSVIVKKLHDAFKKAYDDPKVIEAYEKYDFVRRYLSTEDYQKFVPKLAAEDVRPSRSSDSQGRRTKYSFARGLEAWRRDHDP